MLALSYVMFEREINCTNFAISLIVIPLMVCRFERSLQIQVQSMEPFDVAQVRIT